MEISSSIGAPHVERSAIAKHDGPGEKGSDRAARQFSALLSMSLNLRLVVQHCAQQRSMHFDLSVVADETQLAELVHEKTDPRAGGADHLRQCFLADIRLDQLRAARLAEIRQQQQ